jgi:flagellar biosynthesis GTPase FlhF
MIVTLRGTAIGTITLTQTPITTAATIMPQNTNTDVELTENSHSERSPLGPEMENETEPDGGIESEAEAEVALEIGTVVHDVEDDNPDDAVVVNTPPVEVSEWTVSNTDTVASMNPGYPEDSIVIVVIFLSTLTHTDAYSDWDGEDPIGLPADCQTYAFPRGRLRRVGTYPQPQPQSQSQQQSEKDDKDRDQSDTDTDTDSDSDVDTPDQEKETHRQQQADDTEQQQDENKESESEIPPVERLTTAQQNLRERLSARSEVDVEPDPDDPTSAVLVVQKLGEEHRIAADGTVSDGPVADRLAEIAQEYLS